MSTNDGGASEYARAAYWIPGTFYFTYKLVLPLSSTLQHPKIFACPVDLERVPATNFSQFNDTNLSYDIGLIMDVDDPRFILAADRGLPTRLTNGYTLRHLPTAWTPSWTGAHGRSGNILFSDGHVGLSYNASLAADEAINEDLAYPSVRDAVTVAVTGGGGGGGSGGGGGGGGGGSGGGSTGSSTTSGSSSGTTNAGGPMNVLAGTRSGSSTGTQAMAGGSNPSQPTAAVANEIQRPQSANHLPGRSHGSGSGQFDSSNSVPDGPAVTNATPSVVAATGNDDPAMSTVDRKVANVLRKFFATSYLLILLVLLLYAAYRYWRWSDGRRG